MIFLFFYLATLLFFSSQNHAAQVFFVSFYAVFSVLFGQKSKKIWQFFAIFSPCVSTS